MDAMHVRRQWLLGVVAIAGAMGLPARAHAAAGDDENDATDPSRLIARLQKFGEQLQRMGERLGAMQDRLDGADTDVRLTVHPAVVALLTQIDGVRAVAEGLAAVTSPNG